MIRKFGGLRRMAAASVVAAFLAVSTITFAPVVASASGTSVPFTDPYANGALTLCGRDDKPVTSGSLLTVPFVWKVVSSAPAPPKYTRAFLALYQPIQHEDPSGWSGYQLLPVAIFNDPAHPVAQATDRDPPLEGADHIYPPYWDGLYELRMFFAGPGLAPFNASYPASVIRVQGSTWSLVQGGPTPCNAGSAVAVEALLLPSSQTQTPESVILNTKPNTGPGTTLPKGSSLRRGSSHASTTSVPSTSHTEVTQASGPQAQASGANGGGSSGHSGGGLPVGVVIALSGLAAAMAVLVARRLLRRRVMTP